MKLIKIMKAFGKTTSEVMKIEKVLRILNSYFDYVVAAIEKSKHMEQMILEDLQESQSSLIKDQTISEKMVDRFFQVKYKKIGSNETEKNKKRNDKRRRKIIKKVIKN